MRLYKIALAIGASLILGACNATSTNSLSSNISASPAEIATWDVAAINVAVPNSLTVSQDPSIQFPNVDIVWYGEPDGDRRAQVGTVVESALKRGFSPLTGTERKVAADVTVLRFHAVTPRAREGALPAWHDVDFAVRVRDIETGAILAEQTVVETTVPAYTGEEARRAVLDGFTQRVRIENSVASGLQRWLTSSGATLGGDQ